QLMLEAALPTTALSLRICAVSPRHEPHCPNYSSSTYLTWTNLPINLSNVFANFCSCSEGVSIHKGYA
ncbi:MAG: hypothetical protein II670_14840, partial [Alphaproteobacteria bacterium]|nr:hypothetical protein [Alphaproteobacteria bacterium]